MGESEFSWGVNPFLLLWCIEFKNKYKKLA